jgi:hypothetical protein
MVVLDHLVTQLILNGLTWAAMLRKTQRKGERNEKQTGY